MGASRYLAVTDYTDQATGRTYHAFADDGYITGSEYERLGEPSAFKPADYPSEVDQLREEHGLDAEPAAEGTQYDEEAELEARNVDELRKLAADRDIAGRSDMNKAELIQALRQD